MLLFPLKNSSEVELGRSTSENTTPNPFVDAGTCAPAFSTTISQALLLTFAKTLLPLKDWNCPAALLLRSWKATLLTRNLPAFAAYARPLWRDCGAPAAVVLK